jgi:hypothetical protein
MKNKAKRLEYLSEEQFLADFDRLKTNAEIFNGNESMYAEQARQLAALAQEEVNKNKAEVKSFEMLVKEKVEMGLLNKNLNI